MYIYMGKKCRKLFVGMICKPSFLHVCTIPYSAESGERVNCTSPSRRHTRARARYSLTRKREVGKRKRADVE